MKTRSKLDLPQFHLFDRETHEVGNRRAEQVRLLNLLPRCRATLTSKRSLENYLHPLTIAATFGIELAFDDDSNVAEMLAEAVHRTSRSGVAWETLPPRSRKRRRERIKHVVNDVTAARMSIDELHERDPAGETVSWLKAIQELASQI